MRSMHKIKIIDKSPTDKTVHLDGVEISYYIQRLTVEYLVGDIAKIQINMIGEFETEIDMADVTLIKVEDKQ